MVIKPPAEFRKFTIIAVGIGRVFYVQFVRAQIWSRPHHSSWIHSIFCLFLIHQCTGNIGNILLVLLDAICSNSNSPFGDYSTCSEEAVAYISFGQWVHYCLNPPIHYIYWIWFHLNTFFFSVLHICTGWSSDRLYLCLLHVISSSELGMWEYSCGHRKPLHKESID